MNLKNITYEYEHHDSIFYRIALGNIYPPKIEDGMVWHDDYFEECTFEQAAINTACYLIAAYDCGILKPKVSGFGCIKAILFDLSSDIKELYTLDDLRFQWMGTDKSLAALFYMAFGILSISGKLNSKGEITKYSIKSERIVVSEDLESKEESEEKFVEKSKEEWKKYSSCSHFLTKFGEYFDVPNLRNSAKQLAPLRDKESGKDIKLKEVEIMYKVQERAKAYQNELVYLEKMKSALQKIIDNDLENFKQGYPESKLQEIKDYVVEKSEIWLKSEEAI